MTFGPTIAKLRKAVLLGSTLAASMLAAPAIADNLGYAVVPTQIIYPGEEIDTKRLQTVEVTNKGLVGGYARDISEVQGLVTTRTLLPGRTIQVSALRQPYTVKRGDKILLVYDHDGLRITASGTPLGDGVIGELLQVRNTDTGVIISGTVMPDRSVLVVQK
jgi:flagella basal body P-ring formation protein FlgA